MRKKIFSVILAASMVAGLMSGCGSTKRKQQLHHLLKQRKQQKLHRQKAQRMRKLLFVYLIGTVRIPYRVCWII